MDDNTIDRKPICIKPSDGQQRGEVYPGGGASS